MSARALGDTGPTTFRGRLSWLADADRESSSCSCARSSTRRRAASSRSNLICIRRCLGDISLPNRFRALNGDRIDAGFGQQARFRHCRCGADYDNAAAFERGDLSRRRYAESETEHRRTFLQYRFQLCVERTAGYRRQRRRRQSELGMRLGHDCQHRLWIDTARLVTAGEQIDIERS